MFLLNKWLNYERKKVNLDEFQISGVHNTCLHQKGYRYRYRVPGTGT
jgi:hypothetical protein